MDYTTKLSNNTNPSFKMTRKEEIIQAGINYTLANKPRCIAGDNFADISDEYNLKIIYDLFEHNKKLNEVQGNTNVAQTIEAFQKGWLKEL